MCGLTTSRSFHCHLNDVYETLVTFFLILQESLQTDGWRRRILAVVSLTEDEQSKLMTVIELSTYINAPIELVFDLARDLDLHQESTSRTREKIVAGRSTGLVQLDDEITFEAVHFGVRQRLTSKIIELKAPHRFVDRMTNGAFRSLEHIHEFESVKDGTIMRDKMTIAAPLGPLGVVAERLFLAAYMRRFLEERNTFLKRTAESREGR